MYHSQIDSSLGTSRGTLPRESPRLHIFFHQAPDLKHPVHSKTTGKCTGPPPSPSPRSSSHSLSISTKCSSCPPFFQALNVDCHASSPVAQPQSAVVAALIINIVIWSGSSSNSSGISSSSSRGREGGSHGHHADDTHHASFTPGCSQSVVVSAQQDAFITGILTVPLQPPSAGTFSTSATTAAPCSNSNPASATAAPS